MKSRRRRASLIHAIPEDLEGILGRAMEKDRGNRYQTALAMKGDLQSLKKESEPGLTTSARMRPALPYKLRTDTFEAPTRRWYVWALLGVIALLLTILVPVGGVLPEASPGRAGSEKHYRRVAAAKPE